MGEASCQSLYLSDILSTFFIDGVGASCLEHLDRTTELVPCTHEVIGWVALLPRFSCQAL